jgi:hypothetical protein
MLELRDIKARIDRLEALAKGLAEDGRLGRPAGDAVLDGWEHRAYVRAVEDARAGVDEARNLLAAAVRRVEGA